MGHCSGIVYSANPGSLCLQSELWHFTNADFGLYGMNSSFVDIILSQLWSNNRCSLIIGTAACMELGRTPLVKNSERLESWNLCKLYYLKSTWSEDWSCFTHC